MNCISSSSMNFFPILQHDKSNYMSQHKQNVDSVLFNKENYTWMLIGGVVIALGMFLLSGGRSAEKFSRLCFSGGYPEIGFFGGSSELRQADNAL